MSLRFYIGASGAGKSTALYREIIERSMKHPEQNFFLIVPDQCRLRQSWCGCIPERGS